MGNTHVKPHPRQRNKKQVHWRAAARPQPPGKPQLTSEVESTPDLVTICWKPPISDGGSPILGYLVEHRRTGSPHWVRSTPIPVPNPEVTISGLEPGWRYQFRISAQNAVGISDPSDLSEPITVTLQRSAITAPKFTQDVQETTALENEKAEFIVHFLGQPAPRVCWFKDEFEIFSSRRIRIVTESDKSILTIYQCSLSDEGEIKCTATNRAGHVSSKAKLTVESFPSIRLPRQYEEGLLFEIGESIKLKVSVAGRPTPLVFWSHDGESINNNDRYDIEYADKMSVLKIAEAERSDRGEYEVKAVNKLGHDIQSFLVTITDKPSPPGKAKVVMTLGRSVTLSWSTPEDDGGYQIGNYIIEYYRLGWNVWLKAATSRQVTTVLGDLIEGSEYKFRVKAESSYGISEPSEETEVIFIPDPKRGILEPPTRGRSQPREVSHGLITPVARRKHRNRSLSSSRVESTYVTPNSVPNATMAPKRPERTKVKSPPKTPEPSPLVKKREVDAKANRELFERSDRSSMARELSYGSPEIRLKRDTQKITLLHANPSSGSEKSRTPSPTSGKAGDHKFYKVKIEPPSGNGVKNKSPSPEKTKEKSPRENNENFTGSSEFMLVLYPGENEKGKSSFEFDNDSVPPPMSLSAPELGADSSIFNNIRRSASSTELLYEKTMLRLYEAAEEEELKKKEQTSTSEIPKIQINSKDNQKIVGLERKHSLIRRLSIGGPLQKQSLLSQRRHTLVSPIELKSALGPEEKLRKFPGTLLDKQESMMRQRSQSVENEENIPDREMRQKTVFTKQSITNRREMSISDEEKWADDYESSTEDSESSEEDDDLREIQKHYKKTFYDDEGEQETYHPRLMTGMLVHPINDKEPFEILTKRKEPPSPDFVPKPILKKVEPDKELKLTNSLAPTPSPRSGSHSPLSPGSPQRSRSQSIAGGSFTLPSSQKPVPEEKLGGSRPRSLSLTHQEDLLSKKGSLSDRPLILQNQKPPSLMHSISAVATITGITAASIVIPDRLLERQKDAEEAKVVIDHYGDIVKNYGGRRKSNPQILMDRDALKEAAEELGNYKNETLKKVESLTSEPKNVSYREGILKNELVISSSETNVGGNKAIQKPKRENYITQDRVVEKNEDRNRFANIYEHFQDYTKSNSLPEQKTVEDITNRIKERSISKSPPRNGKTGSNANDLNSSSPRDDYWDYVNPKLDTSIKINSARSDIRTRRGRTSPSPIRNSTFVPPTISNEQNIPLGNSMQRRNRTSPSPVRSQLSKTPPNMYYSRRSTPSPLRRARPMFREIMTQTSDELMSLDSDSYSRASSPSGRSLRQEKLIAAAEVKVHRFVDYITDLAMFAVACWLYLFKNELLAIPVLMIMVYRQLQAEILKRIPKWLLRRIRRRHRK
ncbi:myomesin and myosin binding protein [Leptinotarsa decemlineata]|uniref:myomesin and myosin binding protein n=1 Tax=Leptinotarsa decemlineata TaxID=7539 RepID=UPI003D30B962